jgi:hypothetical protein
MGEIFVEYIREMFKNSKNLDWVLYKHGTYYVASKNEILTREQLCNIANFEIEQFEQGYQEGSSSADFSVIRLDGIFPDKPVYGVYYDNTFCGNILLGTKLNHSVQKELRLGLEARRRRTADAKKNTIIATSRD